MSAENINSSGLLFLFRINCHNFNICCDLRSESNGITKCQDGLSQKHTILKLIRGIFSSSYNWIVISAEVQATFQTPLHLIIISCRYYNLIPFLCLTVWMDLVSKPQGRSMMSLTRSHFPAYLLIYRHFCKHNVWIKIMFCRAGSTLNCGVSQQIISQNYKTILKDRMTGAKLAINLLIY